MTNVKSLKKRAAAGILICIIGALVPLIGGIQESPALAQMNEQSPNLVCDLRLVRMDKNALRHDEITGMTFVQADKISEMLRDVGASADDVESTLRDIGADWRTLAHTTLVFTAGAKGTANYADPRGAVSAATLSIESGAVVDGATPATIEASYVVRQPKGVTTLRFQSAGASMRLGVPLVLSSGSAARMPDADDVVLVATLRLAPTGRGGAAAGL